MIPDLPEGISDKDQLEFYVNLAANLQDQSTIHIRWWTHRQNPSVCWICDLNTLLSKIMDVTGSLNTKSTVDMETSSMSENDSDIEIEHESWNHDEELPIPEYEVEEEYD